MRMFKLLTTCGCEFVKDRRNFKLLFFSQCPPCQKMIWNSFAYFFTCCWKLSGLSNRSGSQVRCQVHLCRNRSVMWVGKFLIKSKLGFTWLINRTCKQTWSEATSPFSLFFNELAEIVVTKLFQIKSTNLCSAFSSSDLSCFCNLVLPLARPQAPLFRVLLSFQREWVTENEPR